MYHDNTTEPPDYIPIDPPSGFTHTYTPNDFKISNDEIMEYYENGYIRIFELLRNNPLCEALNNTCKIMENITKPGTYNLDQCNSV